jgi:serine/threonine protein kinase
MAWLGLMRCAGSLGPPVRREEWWQEHIWSYVMRKIRQLGIGGFGVVDLVEDDDGNRYARKTFSENQPLTPAIRENVIKRFKKESRIQKSVSHQNIVPVIDDNPDADPPYYLMPMAESTLDKDIAADKTLDGNFIAVISDIVAALEELHSVQIYHRDLKPQNVLRFAGFSGDEPVTYYAVSDFGLISLNESQLTALTTTGMAKGSDHYTAPEITKDLRRASPQSDIYSLGCILHDMVGAADRIPCGEIKEDGPYGGIFRGCTRADPARRFKTARSVLDALVSVGSVDVETESRQAADYISELDSDNSISGDIWAALADFTESQASRQDRHAICMNLSGQRITELCEAALPYANQIGAVYADWVFNTNFNFDHCDGIANRIEIFIEHCNFETKVECLVAMLEMGTSHNRWHVERKFMRLCGPSMNDALAKRLAIEFRVREDWVCPAVDHLERSIDVNRSQLHPELVQALAELCQ